MTADIANDKLEQISLENKKLKEEIVDLQFRSMRDNLIFVNISEERLENPDITEKLLLKFLEESLHMPADEVAEIKFERAHRSGPTEKKPRNIVAKFSGLLYSARRDAKIRIDEFLA